MFIVPRSNTIQAQLSNIMKQPHNPALTKIYVQPTNYSLPDITDIKFCTVTEIILGQYLKQAAAELCQPRLKLALSLGSYRVSSKTRSAFAF